MADFRDRERAEESHWSMNQERAFRVRAQRNRLMGLWAARRLGLHGGDALEYAREMATDLRPDDSLVRRIASDFQREGLPVDEAELQATLRDMGAEAAERVRDR